MQTDKIVPLISTSSKGPLGLVHLPRLWLKMRLAAQGRLADGYRAGEGGFDGKLLEALGIDLTAVVACIARQPSYLEFEAWIRESASPEALTPPAIEGINKLILSFPKPEPGRSEMLAALDLPSDDGTVWPGFALNDLDDWQAMHQELTATSSNR